MAHVDYSAPAPRAPRFTAPQPVDDNVLDIDAILGNDIAASTGNEIVETVEDSPAEQVIPVVEQPVSPEPEIEVLSTQTETDGTIQEPEETPIEKPKTKKVAGRPKSGAAAKKEDRKAAKSQEIPKKQSSFYMTPADLKKLRWLCMDNNISMTDFIEQLCKDAMNASFRCKEPGCGYQFVGRTELNDAPCACPVCGSKRLERLYRP